MAMKVSSTSVSIGQGLTLQGRSRAGDGTCFVIPELKWMFDCGALVHNQDPKHIFITHTHSDHIAHLATHFFGNNRQGGSPPNIYVPQEALPFVKNYLQAHYALTSLSYEQDDDADYPMPSLDRLVGVMPGKEIRIGGKKTEYVVTPFMADHRVTCYAYSIVRNGQRLKPEYANLTGPEIGEMRKQGKDIYETYQSPMLCYIGDTTHKVFETNPQILQEHRVILVECSFQADKDVPKADKSKHMHWHHLRPIVQAHPETLFLLNHFSLKHSALQWMELFHGRCEEDGNSNDGVKGSEFPNVHPMLVEYEIQGEWKRRQNKQKSQYKRPSPSCHCFVCTKTRGDNRGVPLKKPLADAAS